MKALSKKYREVFSKNRHVMLMGCHTGTLRSSDYWRDVFPNATMFAGFEPKGPAGSSQASGDYITEV